MTTIHCSITSSKICDALYNIWTSFWLKTIELTINSFGNGAAGIFSGLTEWGCERGNCSWVLLCFDAFDFLKYSPLLLEVRVNNSSPSLKSWWCCSLTENIKLSSYFCIKIKCRFKAFITCVLNTLIKKVQFSLTKIPNLASLVNSLVIKKQCYLIGNLVCTIPEHCPL